MVVINDLIFDLWKHVISFPVYMRQALFIVVISIITGLLVLKFIPFLLKLIAHVVAFVFTQLVGLISWCFSVWMSGRRKRDKGTPRFVHVSETMLDGIIEGANRLKKATKKRPYLKAKFKKGYLWLAFIVIIGFPFLYHSQPQLQVSQKWNQVENWMLAGQSLAAVQAPMEQKMSESESEGSEELLLVRLQSGYDGVKVRENPSLEANSIDVLGLNETATYLGDEKQTEEINWLFVELENGKQGWVSDNIVETYSD